MKIKGVLPALITPLNKEGKLDADAMQRVIEAQLKEGAYGFYVLGATGEGIILDENTRKEAIEVAVKTVNKRVPVVCHIAAMNYAEAKRLAKHAEIAGADMLSALPPLFYHYTEDDIFNYYKGLAACADIPFMVYNHSAANGGLSPEMIAEIFKIDTVTAVKWTISNYYNLMRARDLTNGEINVINGPDESLLQGLTAGCEGGIGTTYNVMLSQFVNLYKCFCNNEMQKALSIQMDVNKVIGVMCKYEIISATKHMCAMKGIEVGEAAAPLHKYSSNEVEAFERELKEANWLKAPLWN